MKNCWKAVALSAAPFIAATAFAQYEEWPSPDTIVARFNDYCNQQRQMTAFNCLIEGGELVRQLEPFRLPEPRQMYNTPAVRTAFRNFVRSFTLEDHRSTCGTNFRPSFYLDSWGNISDWVEEAERSTDMILGMYVGWGFTEELYPIADSLFKRGAYTLYSAFVWNEMGTDYWQYLLSKTSTAPGYTIGISSAIVYLGSLSRPKADIVSIAVSIINAGASSSDKEKRIVTAAGISRAYLEGGQTQLKAKIEDLINDADPDVRFYIRSHIKDEQERGKLLEFNINN